MKQKLRQIFGKWMFAPFVATHGCFLAYLIVASVPPAITDRNPGQYLLYVFSSMIILCTVSSIAIIWKGGFLLKAILLVYCSGIGCLEVLHGMMLLQNSAARFTMLSNNFDGIIHIIGGVSIFVFSGLYGYFEKKPDGAT